MKFDTISSSKCGDCPIRHRAVCARCDETELTQLEAIKSYRTFAAGDPILWRGDPITYVGSVVSGVAGLGKTLEDGRTQTVGLLFPSDFIGRPGRQTIDFDVVAITDVTLCCFQRKPFERLLASTPHISQRLMEMALDELDAARDWMLLLGRKTAREKTATFVRMVARRQQPGVTDSTDTLIELPLNRSEIANYLGLTLETVSRNMGAIQKEGILKFADRRRFQVTDVTGLKRASGDDI